jgi:hypothetical protein
MWVVNSQARGDIPKILQGRVNLRVKKLKQFGEKYRRARTSIIWLIASPS